MQSVSESLPGAEAVLAGHAEHLPVPVAALYVPAPHAKHSTPFDDAVYPATHVQSPTAVLPAAELVCAGHAEQLPAPAAALYVPTSQGVQLVAPSTSEYVPASQAEHAPVPAAALYVPAPHAEHATPFDEAVYPATHVQSVTASLPADELVLAGHAEQSPAPVAALYVPAPQALQATPSTSAV